MLERCFSCFSRDQGQLMIAKQQHDDGTTPYVSTPDFSILPIQLQALTTHWLYNPKTLQPQYFSTPTPDVTYPFVTTLWIEKCIKRNWHFQNLIQNHTHFLKICQESPLIRYTSNVRLVGLRFILFGIVRSILTLVDIQYNVMMVWPLPQDPKSFQELSNIILHCLELLLLLKSLIAVYLCDRILRNHLILPWFVMIILLDLFSTIFKLYRVTMTFQSGGHIYKIVGSWQNCKK